MRKILAQKKIKQEQGFSLVELSIVLVLIGLLTAGIAGGMKLRHASELRGIITDVENYRVAFESFQYKYSDLPGDMSDAYDYWGADCSDTGTADDDKCNGDSDGLVSLDGVSSDNEAVRFWQHLSLSGIIDKSYAGVSTSAYVEVNKTVPAVRGTKGAFSIFRASDLSSYTTLDGNNALVAAGLISTYFPLNKLFSAEEAYAIDKKTDDGLPDKGKTKGSFFYDGTTLQSAQCLTGGAFPDRTYDIDGFYTNPECILIFEFDQ